MSDEPVAGTEALLRHPIRYALESDLGLLVNLTGEHGNHLLLWTTSPAAESMCPAFAGVGRYWVTALELEELVEELEGMRADGMEYVMVDPRPEARGEIFPIGEAIAFYKRLTDISAEARSAGDHFIQRLDRLRQAGVAPDRELELIPVDCPECRGYFTLPDDHYRAWRDHRAEFLHCPLCHAVIREALFGTVICSDCGAESGKMPKSLGDGFRLGEFPWRCLDCGEAAVKAANQNMLLGTVHNRNWYAWVVGGISLVALLAGIYIRFFVMGE